MRHLDPDVERCRGRLKLEPEISQARDQHVTAFLVYGPEPGGESIVGLQCGHPGFLNGLKLSRIQIAFDLAQPGNHFGTAHGKPEPPSRHVERL